MIFDPQLVISLPRFLMCLHSWSFVVKCEPDLWQKFSSQPGVPKIGNWQSQGQGAQSQDKCGLLLLTRGLGFSETPRWQEQPLWGPAPLPCPTSPLQPSRVLVLPQEPFSCPSFSRGCSFSYSPGVPSFAHYRQADFRSLPLQRGLVLRCCHSHPWPPGGSAPHVPSLLTHRDGDPGAWAPWSPSSLIFPTAVQPSPRPSPELSHLPNWNSVHIDTISPFPPSPTYPWHPQFDFLSL